MSRLALLLTGAILLLTPANALGLTASSGDELLNVTGDGGRDELRMRVEGAHVIIKSPEEIVVGSGCEVIPGGARCVVPGGEDPGPFLRLRGGPDLVFLDESLSPRQLQPIVHMGAGRDEVRAGGVFLGSYYGQGGRDLLVGEGSLRGGFGADRIFGGRRWDDFLTGDAGDDRLFGRGGRDTLLGGPGDDYLDGGPGFDSGRGSSGDDTESSIERRYGSG